MLLQAYGAVRDEVVAFDLRDEGLAGNVTTINVLVVGGVGSGMPTGQSIHGYLVFQYQEQ